MNTEQNYVGRGDNATPNPETAQNAAKTPSSPDYRPVYFECPLHAGDQFENVFTGLMRQHREMLEYIIVDFNPGRLEAHLKRMEELYSLEDLISRMVIGINRDAARLNRELRDPYTEFAKANIERAHEAELMRWESMSEFHWSNDEEAA